MVSISNLAIVLPALGVGDASTVAARVVFSVVALIMCVTVHEFGHAFVADRFGYPQPRAQGRVTLNPLAHIDLLGTVIFPALMALGAPIPLGWGKPVEIGGYPRRTRGLSMRTVHLLVSVAGPGMNLLLALVLSGLLLLGKALGLAGMMAVSIMLIRLNFMLMFFNLLPIPPLDGRAFLDFLPRAFAPVRDFLDRYGGFVFLALIMLGGIGNGPGPLWFIMWPFNKLTEIYVRLLLGA